MRPVGKVQHSLAEDYLGLLEDSSWITAAKNRPFVVSDHLMDLKDTSDLGMFLYNQGR